MSKPRICKAGWSANHWGDWKTESKWLWRLSKKHGSNGALGDIGIHIVDFASYGSGLDVAHVFARLKTFDKAPGQRSANTISMRMTASR
jgi:predicted dehydrogenase